jgi:hypothetical protein
LLGRSCWAISSSPHIFLFCFFNSGYFENRASLFAQTGLDYTQSSSLPAIPGMTGMHHHASFFLLRWNLMNFFQSGLEPQSSRSQPPGCLGWQVYTTASSHWLKWGFTYSLPGLASNHDPPYLSLPSN